MATIPHADAEQRSFNCAVLTISDTRTVADDRSGQLLQQLLQDHGHRIGFYGILPDQPNQIQAQVSELIAQPDLPVLILSGGTGIAPRDNTYAAIVGFFNQELPGFGELFRWLSFQEVGSRAIASRAVAGIVSHATAGPTLVFSLPGSQNAVRLAMEKLILPELGHLTKQLQI